MQSEVYFNEFDSFAAEWLRNLFPESTVDKRSITDVKAGDIVRFQRVHFFGGIGGWEYALQLAGWPEDRPVWTGSCPCQPFSSAGKQSGTKDERHLWPEMFRLVRECRPDTIFGEQVASAIRHGWLDGVFADLEAEGYTCGAIVLGAHSVGSPHIRQRLFWVAQQSSGSWTGEWVPVVFAADCDEEGNCPVCGIDYAECGCPGPTQDGYEYEEIGGAMYARRVAQSDSTELRSIAPAGEQSVYEQSYRTNGMGLSFESRLEGYARHGDNGG